MKDCPACGGNMVHAEGGFHCTECTFDLSMVKKHRRHDRRYKRVLRRLDRIGARLAGVR